MRKSTIEAALKAVKAALALLVWVLVTRGHAQSRLQPAMPESPWEAASPYETGPGTPPEPGPASPSPAPPASSPEDTSAVSSSPTVPPPQDRPGPTMKSLIEAYEHLRLSEGAVTVRNLQISSGHMSLTLESGSACPVLAGEDRAGFFFRGNGRFEYVSADPIEFPIVLFNLKKNTMLGVEKGERAVKIHDDFTTLLFLTSGPATDDLKGEPGGAALSKDFGNHRERFVRDKAALVSHDFALRRLNAPTSAFVRAEMGGGKEALVYVLDSARNRSESLYALARSQSEDPEMRKFLWQTVLSDQPIDRDRRDPLPPHVMLGDVDYTLVASDGKDLQLSVKEVIVPVEEGQRVLRFDLDDTTYALVGAGKLDPRHLQVKSVTDARGRDLPFHHQNDELLVDLGRPPPERQPLELRFEIEGDFLIRPNGDNYWELGVAAWFPQPGLGEQAYTLHSMVKVKKPFVAFAPGTTIVRKTEGDYNIVENRVDQPVDFAVVLAGKYQFSEETRGGVTVRVASYASRNEPAMKKLTNLAFGIMEFYQNFLGPFPFSEFNIIEINAFGYGQAPPATMFITQEAFQSQIGELNQIFSRGINERFAHEIAHQYWGHVVKMPSFEEQWLTEAFAEYSAGLFLKKYEGKATYSSLEATWKSNAKEVSDASPIPLANRIRIKNDPLRRFLTRTYLLYDKGAYVLARLHAGMDDKTFLTFLKSYQKTFRWKFGSTKQVTGLLQFLTGKDYTAFFESNYWGTSMP